MFETFNGGVVNPGQVSYLALTIAADTTLEWPSFSESSSNVVASIIEVTASAGSLVITMPDARQAGNGSLTLIRNVGSNQFSINDNTGANIGTIGAGVAKLIYLRDNSTQGGTWGIFTYGTGTSGADASVLAGLGLQAISGTLNQSHPVFSTAAAITISATSSLAQHYLATGGSVACNLPTSASAGGNFFFLLKNGGTGTVTLTPSGGDTVDGAATVALAPNDSCFVMSAGASNAWFTIGLGRSVNFAFTQLVKNVAGSSDVTLTSAECANKVVTLVGLLTGNINVIVTNTVSVYYIYNNTTGAFTLTVKTAAGTGITVTQGSHDIGVCDATNVYRGITNTVASTLFGVGSAGSPSVSFIGNSTTGLYVPSANVLGISANGFEVASFNGPASSVNWLDFFASATTIPARITANGTDANVGLALRGKGTGKVTFQDGTDATKQVTLDVSGVTTATTRAWVFPNVSDTFLGLNSAQSPTNKTFDTTNTVTLKDTLFTLQDDGDLAKQFKFQLSGITTGNTRTWTVPDFSDTFVGLTGAQTLTNKTLTTPTITNPANTDQTLTDAATVAWNMDLGAIGTLTATGGVGATRAMGNPTNKRKGTFILYWIQDAVGGRALTLSSANGWKTSNGITPAFSTGANDVNVISGVCDGTTMWYGLAVYKGS